MLITLDRTNPQPLYHQIVQQIQRRIQSGALPPGAKLPTVRELAQQLGVTRLTVHSAYSELQAGGWVEATVGRGTFVAARNEPQATAAALGQELSAHGIINDMVRMAQLPGMRSLAMADAAPEFYPVREFQRALDEALQGGATSLSYTTSQGEPLPRTVLAELLRERGMHISSDELLITSGVTQGLSLISQTLARPGDMIIVEQPTYLGALNVFGAHGLRVVSVPVDEHGMQVEALEPILLAQQPRFIYTIPVFHNPTGACMSAERRATLLALAERYHVPIVEDDIYATMCYEGAPPPALQSECRDGFVLTAAAFRNRYCRASESAMLRQRQNTFINWWQASRPMIFVRRPCCSGRWRCSFSMGGWHRTCGACCRSTASVAMPCSMPSPGGSRQT